MIICKICKYTKTSKKFEYLKKPEGETIYNTIDYKNYNRSYFKCHRCNHFSGYLKMKIKNLYSSDYNKSIYSGKLKTNFDKINKLPPKKSDNYLRVQRINNFIKKKSEFKNIKKISCLDIGSGLGIFPYKMKKKNFKITALDPDKASCEHIRKNLKINTIHGDFLKLKIKKKFEFISLNKVIEHISNPKKILERVKKILSAKGLIYIEVPDIKASMKGKSREEFHLDHLHVFSKKSLEFLSKSLNLKINQISSIREPSDKFTLFAFLSKK